MGAYDEINNTANNDSAAAPKAKRPPFVPSQPSADQLEALQQLGINDDLLLTQEEKDSLDKNGFLVLPNILSEETCRKIEGLIERLEREEGDAVGMDHEVEHGVIRVGNIVAKDKEGICRDLILHPKILAAVSRIFKGRSFILDSFTSRRVLPGNGLQPLHRDLTIYEMRAANCMVALSPFTANNGATRLVPGTHLQKLPPHKALQGGMAEWTKKHPSEILAVVPRGSVVVNNPQTWHAGTRNDSLQARLGGHFSIHENVAMNVATQSPIPRSVAEKNYSEVERKLLGMLVVDDQEYEARRKAKKPEMWMEIDQTGWERGTLEASRL